MGCRNCTQSLPPAPSIAAPRPTGRKPGHLRPAGAVPFSKEQRTKGCAMSKDQEVLRTIILLYSSGWREWPPRPGLLSDPPEIVRLFEVPITQWGLDEWKAYAGFLERRGGNIARELRETTAKLRDAERKKSRRHFTGKPLSGTLLTGFDEPRPRRGRPPEDTARSALECLAIRAEIEGLGRRVTDLEAIAEWHRRRGLRSARAKGNEGIRIAKAMSRNRRKSHNSPMSG